MPSPDCNRTDTRAPDQQTWADRLIAELLASGIAGFVLSPGSRNTPLTLALARGCPERVVIHQEERGAAFFALGATRAGDRPWGVVCTSGSAVANWMPAVVEASASRIPLILLSADRPESLHHQRANQTMEQAGLFEPHVRLSLNISPPESTEELDRIIRQVHTAYAAATGHHPGPVHLNLAFDEPLISGPLPGFTSLKTPSVRWHRGKPAVDANALSMALRFLQKSGNGLLMVGELRNAGTIRAARSLATRLGWPVYADITSGLRLESLEGLVIPYADLLWEYWAERLGRPDRVLWLGDSLVQRAFPEWLARVAGDCMLVTDHDAGQDPYGMVRERVVSDLEAFCDALAAACGHVDASRERFARELATLDRALDTCAEEMGSCLTRMEPLVARWTLEVASRFRVPVFLGNSMPIRWGGLYARHVGGNATIYASRGVSGIDGAVATASGVSEGMNRRPVVALLGDLTVFHDLPSLALAMERQLPIILVVQNNRGGRIFHHLPQARHCPDLLSPWFTADPVFKDFHSAAEMFGWDYECPSARDAFQNLLESVVTAPDPRPTLVELCLDAQGTRETHELLKKRCMTSLAENAGKSGRNME